MRLAIMQPYLFPYLGYFKLMHAVDRFIVYDDVNFIKRGWIHRNRILVNGQPYLFSLPLSKSSQNKKIFEISIANLPDWRKKFTKTLRHAYGKSTYFKEANNIIVDALNWQSTNLAEFLLHTLNILSGYLNLKTDLIRSSLTYSNSDLHGQDRIIAICEQEKASTYINAIGGQSLYSQDAFNAKGIELQFINFQSPNYKQISAHFIPNLSIIDVLMSIGLRNTRYFITKSHKET